MRTLLEEITEYKQLHDKLSSSLKADGCKYTLVEIINYAKFGGYPIERLDWYRKYRHEIDRMIELSTHFVEKLAILVDMGTAWDEFVDLMEGNVDERRCSLTLQQIIDLGQLYISMG